ncbi:MAG: TVP38/TMEM64 family protein [Candidatus Moranbacteria bacterium]|jgi:uncharacterized membrane protein YdjX (TVP38/TMEM64 family)|nr:TVP38/TMEM64 family protein [Candidatus Moranbacteria bacterium]
MAISSTLKELMSESGKWKSMVSLMAYLALMFLAGYAFGKYVDREFLQSLVQYGGIFGVVAYFLVEVVYVTLTPLFNTAILIGSGYVFGGHAGFVMNFCAVSVGLLLIVLLVKWYGRSLLQRLLPRRYAERFDGLAQRIGPITLLIVYILPFTPDDELTYIVAAGPIGMRRFILPVVIGTAAKSTYSYIGDRGADGVVIASAARVVLLFVGLIVIGIQEYWFAKRFGRPSWFSSSV